MKLIGIWLAALLVAGFLCPANSIQTDQRSSAIQVKVEFWPQGKPLFLPLHSQIRFNGVEIEPLRKDRGIKIMINALEFGYWEVALGHGEVLGLPTSDYLNNSAWLKAGFANHLSGFAALEMKNYDEAVISFDAARGFMERANAPEIFVARTRIDKQIATYLMDRDRFVIQPEVLSFLEKSESQFPIDYLLVNKLLSINYSHLKDDKSRMSADSNVKRAFKEIRMKDKKLATEITEFLKLIDGL
jgi:hypothetical protein